MPQTLLALAAIFAFGYLALNHQRMDQQVESRAIAVELDLAASDVARALMTRVEQHAFDEDDTGRTGVRTQPSPLALGPDDGEDGPGRYDDVDDWNGHTDTRTVPIGEGSVTFRTVVAVRYVDDADLSTRSARATLTKEISVGVVEVVPDGISRPPATAVLQRVVTPAQIASTSPR